MTERGFSVKLLSKEYVLNVSISEKGGEGVLFEGVLGELEGLEVIEDAVLRIIGSKGTLMVDLSEEELRARSRKSRRVNLIDKHNRFYKKESIGLFFCSYLCNYLEFLDHFWKIVKKPGYCWGIYGMGSIWSCTRGNIHNTDNNTKAN